MVKYNNHKGPQATRSGRVGRFHFSGSGPRRYRLVAVLLNGDRLPIGEGPSIGDLWRQPVVIDPEIESEVIDLRVEQRVGEPPKAEWKPLETSRGSRRWNDES